MKKIKKSKMFTELVTYETDQNEAFRITNTNFKKVEKELKKKDEQIFEFMMQIDSLQDQLELLNYKPKFKFNFYEFRTICKQISECLTVPAILSIIYYCFK